MSMDIDERGEQIPQNYEEEEEEPEGEVGEEPDVDNDCDEEVEGSGTFGEKSRRGRSVTLQMLMADGTLQHGEGVMCVEYLVRTRLIVEHSPKGKKFISDLLPDGKIRWQETGEIFSSPSAWASHCKRLLNPEKKSGCGWASIKYLGKKLDILKTVWLEKHNKSYNEEMSRPNKNSSDDINPSHLKESNARSRVGCAKLEDGKRPLVKHSSLGNRSIDHDSNTLVECTPFCALGKIQPFTVTITTNCLLLMDFHCHLTKSEIVGYLAGNWDVNSHSKHTIAPFPKDEDLAIQQAFPCRCRLGDRENAPVVEEEIRLELEKNQLLLIGWYHSHPTASVHPTLRDIDCQMDYQIRLKGDSDACYTPCVGVICSPYDKDCMSLESSIQAYWVMPPPENKPHEYGKPMLMTFSLIQENFVTQEVKSEIDKLKIFYKEAPDLIPFETTWKDNITYKEKLEKSLLQKAPAEEIESLIEGVMTMMVKS